MSLRLKQCFGPFMMLPVKTSSETGICRHLSNHFIQKYISYGSHLFCKCSKFNADFKKCTSIPWFRKNMSYGTHVFFWKCSKFNGIFQNEREYSEKVLLSFWDKSIWTGCIKFFLLRREYLPSAVNVLTNNRKILHVTKRYFFEHNYFHSDQ